MAELTEKCKQIMLELESKIKDPNDLETAKIQVYDLLESFLQEVERIQDEANKRIEKLIQNQSKLDIRLSNIEKDIYEDGSDVDIVCPYCNHEFVVDDEELTNNEIICPECNNTIELDWNDENELGCSGSCGSCGGCGYTPDDSEDDFIDDEDEDM